MKQVDAIIIGFGKGGKTLAPELAKRGWSVALVERSDRMFGGTCINVGCIPTKALVHSAKLASSFTNASWFERMELYRQAVVRKNQITELLRGKNYALLADHKNITIYIGEGRFVSPDVVAVERDGETTLLTAPHIFIDTGAKAVIPPIDGIAGNRHVFDSASLMELTELPRRLVIVGGGYIGLEFASIFASFGSEVTVLESAPELLGREDRDMAEAIRLVMESKGVTFRTHVQVLSVSDSPDGVLLSCVALPDKATTELTADAVLLATGRTPDTAGLNLGAAGVLTDARGAIVTDERLKTSNPAIRALGDVTGGLQFTYVSLDDYRIICDDLFGNKTRTTADRNPVPYAVFIDPPFSRIGLSEREARERYPDIRVNSLPVSGIPRMKTIGESEGLLKSVVDGSSGRILGCALFCPESPEVINEVSLAMKAGLNAAFLHDFIFTHPSMSEALNDLFRLPE